ncbi:MAG: acylglycerol-3-phosphate acyltransferase [Amphiamblys sp. WSBS2006]|nr:MAG: acylglycerol-3-phosphate acyltransferase [Amphiamblys sp. WSBS2006]
MKQKSGRRSGGVIGKICWTVLFLPVFLGLCLLANLVLLLLVFPSKIWPVACLKINAVLGEAVAVLLWEFFTKILGLSFRTENTAGLSPSSRFLLIANHIWAFDFLLVNRLADKIHRLDSLRYTLKEPLAHIPLLGPIFSALGYVFLSRDKTKDRGRVKEKIAFYEKTGLGYGVVLFPEGTRYTPQKQRLSAKYAKRNRLPVLKNVLLPHTGAFFEAASAMKKAGAKTIICATLLCRDRKTKKRHVPCFWDVLRLEDLVFRAKIQKRYLGSVPDTRKEAGCWLRTLFANVFDF